MDSTRRRFMIAAAASGTALTATVHAQARLDEKDPQALALGYVADAARADAKKFAKYAPGQNCAGCALYQGKAVDPLATVPFMEPGR
jgi:hypothetical protein